MAQDISAIVEKLNALMALDMDAVDACESAMRCIEGTGMQERLRALQADHERHIRELSVCVVALDAFDEAWPPEVLAVIEREREIERRQLARLEMALRAG